MLHQKEVIIFENNIKQQLSILIPDNGVGLLIREIIFSNSKVDWFATAKLIVKHFPEKSNDIVSLISKINEIDREYFNIN